ncbi:MAG: GNAT family N-acetyltransferase [Bacillota bacterium]|nr:GNAT family N-acetyltransferase [Bacillota bacterium]MDO4860850.1 GNAT family N-acetyltransferase [Bacillota bacterium]
MGGTVELKTSRLVLRRHQSEDAAVLFEIFGSDPQMFEYSGWNPYQTRAMATETVASFIKSYDDPHFYGWGIVRNGKLIGTIGAYDYEADKSRIEIGTSIGRAWWGQGFATEAVTAVLRYLSEHEHIKTVSAWCASDNIGSRKAMEKAGMKMVRSDRGALEIDRQTYDKLIFEYAMR